MYPSKIEVAIQVLAEQGFEGMASTRLLLLNRCMKIERQQAIGAAPYERSEARRGQLQNRTRMQSVVF